MRWHLKVGEKLRSVDFTKLRLFSDSESEHRFYVYRSFVEWTFKVAGWLILIGTFHYAYEKTGHSFFKIAEFVLIVAVSALAGVFVEASFYQYKRDAPPLSWRALLIAVAFGTTVSGTQLIVSTAVDAIVTFQKNAATNVPEERNR